MTAITWTKLYRQACWAGTVQGESDARFIVRMFKAERYRGPRLDITAHRLGGRRAFSMMVRTGPTRTEILPGNFETLAAAKAHAVSMMETA